jgi:hypothetical protein
MADVVTAVAVVAVVVAFQTSAMHAVVWTTSCRLVRPRSSDDALMKKSAAKRKLIIQKYGTLGIAPPPHTAHLSDIPQDNSHDTPDAPTLEDCIDEYDDTEVSVPFAFVAFSSSFSPHHDLSHFRVVDSACTINLIAFRDDFVCHRWDILVLVEWVLALWAAARFS